MNIPLATWPTADLTVLAGQEMSERYQVFEWDFVHYIYHLKLVMKVKTALAPWMLIALRLVNKVVVFIK